jgi:hypothetical protein
MDFNLSNVEYPLPPVSYDATGFATGLSLFYMGGEEAEPIKGVPLLLELDQVVSVYKVNDYGKMRMKIKVPKTDAQVVKQVHQGLLRVKDKLFGPSAKVGVPIWDEELTVGFPIFKKELGVVKVVMEDHPDQEVTWQEANKLLPDAEAVEVTMNVWAQTKEGEGTRVGYYYTLKTLFMEFGSTPVAEPVVTSGVPVAEHVSNQMAKYGKAYQYK